MFQVQKLIQIRKRNEKIGFPFTVTIELEAGIDKDTDFATKLIRLLVKSNRALPQL